MKKLILAALFTLTSTIALATSIMLPPSYNSFKSIAADGFVASPLCPDDLVCVANGTVIDIDYTFPCTQDIVSFAYESKVIGKELHVFVNAVVGSNFTDEPVCQAFNHHTETITLINSYGDIVIHNLGVQTHALEAGK